MQTGLTCRHVCGVWFHHVETLVSEFGLRKSGQLAEHKLQILAAATSCSDDLEPGLVV